ncbi:MAG: hypothetical protein KC464_04615 [Myxococcales bacterium]|nr:hypothetical protein [Myxococcales bacterium]
MRWLRAYRVHLLLFAAGLLVYGAVAGDRLARQSSDPHFVLQADAWRHGRIAIDRPRGDDWAKVETVRLDDGRVVRGRRLTTRKTFRVAGGGELPQSRIVASQGTTTYMSFPPVPALLMLPQVMVAGPRANDVAFTIAFAAACLPLLFSVLRRLHAAGASRRTVADDLWLVALFGVGTVFFFSAVQGKVWFTAHVVGVCFALAYAWASIDARHPVLAGVALGLATMTRTPMAFMFPLFAFEAWRVAGGLPALRAGGDDRRAAIRAMLRRGLAFAPPILVIAGAAVAYNLHRFGEPTEFGHSYLAVRQQAQIEAHGLFSYTYLARNLAVAFTLLPELPGKAPWLQISGHGLAMWVTTPALLLLLWPAERPPLHRALWLTVAAVAVPTFFYQNSGWVQFGYRFSLDYLPFLILLLAIGGRRFGWGTRALIVVGIVVNLFGATTFGRHPEYYRTQGAAYGTVVAD